jgi:hypothetical protein
MSAWRDHWMQTKRPHVQTWLAVQQGTWPGKMHGQSSFSRQPTQLCVSGSHLFLLPVVQFASPRQATHFPSLVLQYGTGSLQSALVVHAYSHR